MSQILRSSTPVFSHDRIALPSRCTMREESMAPREKELIGWVEMHPCGIVLAHHQLTFFSNEISSPLHVLIDRLFLPHQQSRC